MPLDVLLQKPVTTIVIHFAIMLLLDGIVVKINHTPFSLVSPWNHLKDTRVCVCGGGGGRPHCSRKQEGFPHCFGVTLKKKKYYFHFNFTAKDDIVSCGSDCIYCI